MTKKYTDPGQLARFLRETELVADKFFNGGVMLIKKKEGWRAFLFDSDEDLAGLEQTLDKNVYTVEKSFTRSSPPRRPSLNDELLHLLSDFHGVSGEYDYPMSLFDELAMNELDDE
jgi:hypothetical protein